MILFTSRWSGKNKDFNKRLLDMVNLHLFIRFFLKVVSIVFILLYGQILVVVGLNIKERRYTFNNKNTMSFKVGQDVVCINADFPNHVIAIYDNLVEKDKIYTIREIDVGVVPVAVDESTKGKFPAFYGPKTQIIYLEGVYNKVGPVSKKEPGFASFRFAPLKEEKEEIKEVIQVKQPKLVEA